MPPFAAPEVKTEKYDDWSAHEIFHDSSTCIILSSRTSSTTDRLCIVLSDPSTISHSAAVIVTDRLSDVKRAFIVLILSSFAHLAALA